ncbi:hypothetical protein BU16DRAFT_585889 [Lophium mytilinum]|uniref:Uncharacterized protein n=1 Tax=Lophium mytilinum TaxID=390894 RepID=A0A6A6QC72_9PEZI|nr:hypothetical protein BU16DRAFT_585889 [Lophium mytilinum]
MVRAGAGKCVDSSAAGKSTTGNGLFQGKRQRVPEPGQQKTWSCRRFTLGPFSWRATRFGAPCGYGDQAKRRGDSWNGARGSGDVWCASRGDEDGVVVARVATEQSLIAASLARNGRDAAGPGRLTGSASSGEPAKRAWLAVWWRAARGRLRWAHLKLQRAHGSQNPAKASQAREEGDSNAALVHR